MKLYFQAPVGLQKAITAEIAQAKAVYKQKNIQLTWHHLERAHILGQSFAVEHTQIHWQMFLLGIKTRNLKEIRGQTIRLIFGGVLSLAGKIPIGNIGSSKVSATLPMPIPEDLSKILKQYI